MTEGGEADLPSDLSPCWGWALFLPDFPEAMGDSPVCDFLARTIAMAQNGRMTQTRLGDLQQTLRLLLLTPLMPTFSIFPSPSIFIHSTPFSFPNNFEYE